MNEIELVQELRKVAKQNLIDRDWFNITENDISNEMSRILVENYFGVAK